MTEPADNHSPAGDDDLRCGRSVDGVLEQVAGGRAADRDPHQLRCPHCQAALAEYARVWSPLQELAAQKVSAPEGAIEQALARIHGAISYPDYGTLPAEGGRGVTRISARVVVVAARQSAQRVSGVRVALGQHLDPTRGTDPPVTAGVAGASTAIEITLAADYGLDLLALGDRVRDAVTARVRALTDLEPVEVTVVIDDVLP